MAVQTRTRRQATTRRRGRNMPTAPAAPANARAAVAGEAIDRAKRLAYESSEIGKLVNSNREFLRLLDANGVLTDSQGDWLDKFYPEKKKGEERSEDDIKNTRTVKEEARKDGKDLPPVVFSAVDED